MKFSTKYEIGDIPLVKGSCLEIGRVLTIKEILIKFFPEKYVNPDVYYGFKETKWMSEEDEIIRKVST